jgi:hypothetical protein
LLAFFSDLSVSHARIYQTVFLSAKKTKYLKIQRNLQIVETTSMISEVVSEGLLDRREQLQLAIGGECALVGESHSPIGRVLVYKASDLKSMPAYYLLAWWWCCVVPGERAVATLLQGQRIYNLVMVKPTGRAIVIMFMHVQES